VGPLVLVLVLVLVLTALTERAPVVAVGPVATGPAPAVAGVAAGTAGSWST
jgi:hypothetical protein